MGGKLFVGGLAWGTEEEGLRSAFEEFGKVREAKVITDRETGRSRGFGFVTFESEADAKAAQQGMDGANLDGRSIRVNEAEDRRGPGGGGGGGARRDAGGPAPEVHRRGGGDWNRDDGSGGERPPRRFR